VDAGVIGPPPDSVASPAQFVCGTDGVSDATEERKARTRGEIEYLGMWHTHPRMRAHASLTDVSGMLGLVANQDAREAVMLIVGGRIGAEELSGFVFNGDQLRSDERRIEIVVRSKPTDVAPQPARSTRDVGLALSGGGSRALAFHLGCLRALHDRDVLSRTRIVSGVSGGALMAALYSYGVGSFDEFDARVVELLRRGLHRPVARRALLSKRLPQDVATRAIAGSGAALGAMASRAGIPGATQRGMRRWVSRTEAFEDVLMEVLGDGLLKQSRRHEGLDVVINACDLKTGTAFRFGSRESSNSRLGRLSESPAVATAVAASAAYPLLLPALDRTWEFVKRDGSTARERVVLADGGVYDNSGTSCLKPGRSASYTYNVFPVDYIIACDAGRGQLAEKVPFHMVSRVNRAFEASFRKLQDSSRSYLHAAAENGELKGFVMPYLGQIDARLPWAPPGLVSRADVADYPTDFAAMDAATVDVLTARGETLTRLLIERWCPDL
jgi:NTE family protein